MKKNKINWALEEMLYDKQLERVRRLKERRGYTESEMKNQFKWM